MKATGKTVRSKNGRVRRAKSPAAAKRMIGHIKAYYAKKKKKRKKK